LMRHDQSLDPVDLAVSVAGGWSHHGAGQFTATYRLKREVSRG
jgi:hypothetical protein